MLLVYFDSCAKANNVKFVQQVLTDVDSPLDMWVEINNYLIKKIV